MTRHYKLSTLLTAATIVLATIAAGASQQASRQQAPGTPATIPASIAIAAEKIANDPQVLAIVQEQSTDAAAKARWNNFLELVRIPSPPRYEHLKAREIHRRLVKDWGFSPDEVMTQDDGILRGNLALAGLS